jgi:hypothetical protein
MPLKQSVPKPKTLRPSIDLTDFARYFEQARALCDEIVRLKTELEKCKTPLMRQARIVQFPKAE